MESYQTLARKVQAALHNGLPNKDSELRTVMDFVEAYRLKHHIIPTPGIKIEPSCEAFGEGRNLLYCQLVKTPEGEGGWLELENGAVRKLVLAQIQRDLEAIL